MQDSIKSNYYDLALKEADAINVNDESVLNLLDKGVEHNDDRAIFARASCYEDGKYGSEIDKKKSNYLFMKLKNSYLAEALFAIAYCYDTGDGVKRNALTAFSYYLRSATLGHKEANFQVSEYYREGHTVARNAVLQRFFLARAELEEVKISPPQRVLLRPLPSR